MKRLLTLLLALVILYVLWQAISSIPNLATKISPKQLGQKQETIRVTSEENVVISVVKKVGSSVVTIGIDAQSLRGRSGTNFDPFSFFFNEQPTPNQQSLKESYIGSGFVIKKEGIIVTNKHVVSDTSFKYLVVDDKGNKYQVGKIYRDPLNDLAILKISNPPAGGFQEVNLGDSRNLQVGQMAIAIGTALGEFRNTVTTGVISGLGRGITAGSPYEGSVERLDNVIQTDAAINPGNSGGPLLNSSGQVIGINAAVSSQGQNIGFAIPINVIKDSLNNFNETGQFNRPFLGVSYRMISQRAAVLNDVPEGALVEDVVQGSSAERAGVIKGDIITKLDGQKLTDQNGGLAAIIAKKKVGESLTITVFRDGKVSDLQATLQTAPGQ